jgi:hypothetical protein
MNIYSITYISKHKEEYSEIIYAKTRSQAIDQFKRRYKLKPIEIFIIRGTDNE